MTEDINTLGNSTVTSNMRNKSKEGVIGPIYKHIRVLNDGNSQIEDDMAITERNDTDSRLNIKEPDAHLVRTSNPKVQVMASGD